MKNKAASELGKLSVKSRHYGKTKEEISQMYSVIAKKSRKKRVIPNLDPGKQWNP